MVDKMTYATVVAEQLNGEVKIVEKANGVKMYGVIIGDGEVRSTSYIDEAFDAGKDPYVAAKEIAKMIGQANAPDVDAVTAIMSDFSKAKKLLRLRLYHEGQNADIKISAAEYGFDDLELIPYIEGIVDNGSIKVTNQIIKMWGVTADEVIEVARKNSLRKGEYKLSTMASILRKFGIPIPFDDDNMPMKVVTNKRSVYGAFGVIALKEKLEKEFPNGYTVLPSSVHEVIIIPSEMEMDELAKIIVEINTSTVRPEEVLSDHAYEFSLETV